MLLKNNKGIKREFEIVFEIEKEGNKYIVYRDPVTDNIYSGRKDENKLKKLSEEEFEYIKKVIDKIDG